MIVRIVLTSISYIENLCSLFGCFESLTLGSFYFILYFSGTVPREAFCFQLAQFGFLLFLVQAIQLLELGERACIRLIHQVGERLLV